MNNNKILLRSNNQASPDFLEFVNFTNQCLTQSVCHYAYQKGFEQGQNSFNILTIPNNNNNNNQLNGSRNGNSSKIYSNKSSKFNNFQPKKSKDFQKKDNNHKNKTMNCSICNYQFESSYQGKNNILCKRCMNNNYQ